jgi:hypothetical protein
MRVLPTIAITNGTQGTTDMLVGIMSIHQMDTKHTCSLGMDSSAGNFMVIVKRDEMGHTLTLILLGPEGPSIFP